MKAPASGQRSTGSEPATRTAAMIHISVVMEGIVESGARSHEEGARLLSFLDVRVKVTVLCRRQRPFDERSSPCQWHESATPTSRCTWRTTGRGCYRYSALRPKPRT